jgi:hypothetical protein
VRRAAALYRPSLLIALLPFAPELPRVAYQYDEQRHDSDDENDEADHLTFGLHDRLEVAEQGVKLGRIRSRVPETPTVSRGSTAVIFASGEPTAA